MSGGGGKDQNTEEKVALENQDRSRVQSFRERHDRVHGKEDRRFRRYQCCRSWKRPLGSLKKIIDKELERSCVEKSARKLADKATADSSTAERKVRQQVDQRRKESKQPKVQNGRGELDEMTSRVR